MNEKKVAIYARVAQKEVNQGNMNPLKQQLEACLTYAKNKFGEDVNVEFFIDNGASGLSMNRNGLQRLLQAVNVGHISSIIVKDYSRLGRSFKHLHELNVNFDKASVSLHSINRLPKDFTYGGFISFMAKCVHETHSQRIKSALQLKK